MQSSRRRRAHAGQVPHTAENRPRTTQNAPTAVATGASGRADRAIRLGRGPDEGIFVEGPEAALRRGGEVLDRAALGFLAAAEGAPPKRLPDHILSALFPDRLFCYSDPLVANFAEVRVGTAAAAADLREEGVPLQAFYEPTPFEFFDGEARLVLPDGSAHRVTFREWRKDVANLDHFPVRYRRVVDLSLPESLAEHRSDTVLLARLARLVCDLVTSYVESDGRRTSLAHDGGPLTNLFRGGGPPPALFAPALFRRRLKDAYDDDRADGGAPSGRGSGARDAPLPG